MPVFSYLAYPVKGTQKALIEDLQSLNYCEVIPADNKEVVLLTTDTPDKKEETALQKRLISLKSLQSLSMTFGHT